MSEQWGIRPVRRRHHRPHARSKPFAATFRLPVWPCRPAVPVLRRLEVGAEGRWRRDAALHPGLVTRGVAPEAEAADTKWPRR